MEILIAVVVFIVLPLMIGRGFRETDNIQTDL